MTDGIAHGQSVGSESPAVPRHPPKELPPLTPPEAGVCLSNFSCEANVGIEGPTEFVANRPTRVTLVSVRLRLAIVIWTIAAPPPKLRAHEEGHREIAESYYARAKDVAEKLAAGLIGRALAVPVDDSPAMKQAIGKLQEELLNGYQRQISLRSKVAQVQFDLITQHGANSVPESQAIPRALAAEANSR